MSDTRNHTTRDQLAEAIAAHQFGGVKGDYETAPYFRWITCTGCDWTQDIAGMSGYTSWVAAHATHVAAAVRAAAVAETTAAIEALLRQVEDDARENQHLARLSTRQVREVLSGGRTALDTTGADQ